jgi:hypothetical protein
VQPCSRAAVQPCSRAAVQPCSRAAVESYSADKATSCLAYIAGACAVQSGGQQVEMKPGEKQCQRQPTSRMAGNLFPHQSSNHQGRHHEERKR